MIQGPSWRQVVFVSEPLQKQLEDMMNNGSRNLQTEYVIYLNDKITIFVVQRA